MSYYQQYKLPIVSVRPFNIYGIGQTGDSAMLKFISKGSVVAEATVYLVLVRRLGDKHKLIRNIPNEFASYFLKLQLGPNLE